MQVSYVDLAAQYLDHRKEILSAIDKTLTSGNYILGDEVLLFEKNFANLCQVKHAIAVANGTESLVLAMRALGIGPGDEVITAPNSWISSASSIVLAGATPIFIDVNKDQNLNPELLERALSKKTKAIMPVHLTGKMANMDPIMDFARKNSLFVIEDAAQAVGAKYHEKMSGSMGHVGSFSLHPLKNLNGAGDGGVLTTNDDSLAEELRLLRNHGIVSRENIVKWGFNSRLDSLQAAIINVRMQYLDAVTKLRRQNAQIYHSKLSGLVDCPMEDANCFDVYHLYVIQTSRRDQLKNYLKTKGIDTAIHYPVPIHQHRAAANLNYGENSFPVCEAQSKMILSLPIHQNLTQEQVNFVADTIADFMENK